MKLGFLNIWVVLGFVPASVIGFFYDGPFAWNGLLGFWVPAFVFSIQFSANIAMVLRAISAEERASTAPARASAEMPV